VEWESVDIEGECQQCYGCGHWEVHGGDVADWRLLVFLFSNVGQELLLKAVDGEELESDAVEVEACLWS